LHIDIIGISFFLSRIVYRQPAGTLRIQGTTQSTQYLYSAYRVVIRSLLKETSARKVAGRPTSPNQTTLSSKEREKVSELSPQIKVLGELGIDQSLEFSPSGGPTFRTVRRFGCRGRIINPVCSQSSHDFIYPLIA